MRGWDILDFARRAATGSPLRTLLMTLAMAIGVAAVVVLTALGDGARRYVVDQFSSIGTNLVIVLPGRSQTGGFSPANAVSTTPRDLTIDDAQALTRLAAVAQVAPLAVGLSEVAVAGRLREAMVLGTTRSYLAVRRLALAQAMFDSNTLFRVLIEARSRDAIAAARRQATALLKARHDGEEDVTVITQDAVLATFDRVLLALTAVVAAIAAISLAVAGILVMNVMLVAVAQRTGEIGLLKALGAPAATIRAVFLTEAALLSLAGALLGYAAGHAGAWVIRLLYPQFPAWPPLWAVVAALGTAIGTGLLFGVMPARRAARLEPVAALSRR